MTVISVNSLAMVPSLRQKRADQRSVQRLAGRRFSINHGYFHASKVACHVHRLKLSRLPQQASIVNEADSKSKLDEFHYGIARTGFQDILLFNAISIEGCIHQLSCRCRAGMEN